MTKNNLSRRPESNFWSGLSLGAIFGATALFFLGTKQGRERAKKLLEALEDVEEMAGDVIEDIKDHIKHETHENARTASDAPEHEAGVQSIIDKIQSVLPEKNEIKKYFFEKSGSPKK